MDSGSKKYHLALHLNTGELPGGSDSKKPTCKEGDLGSISGLGRSPGEENGNPLQHSCLGNPMDRGAWKVQSVELQESDTTE